jgi:hypothetical protein
VRTRSLPGLGRAGSSSNEVKLQAVADTTLLCVLVIRVPSPITR